MKRRGNFHLNVAAVVLLVLRTRRLLSGKPPSVSVMKLRPQSLEERITALSLKCTQGVMQTEHTMDMGMNCMNISQNNRENIRARNVKK